MFFSTSEVTAGTYAWTADGGLPYSANTFSDSSVIVTFVNGAPTSSDQITGGSIVISVNGSSYNITGSVNTAAGPATFIYDGNVTSAL